MIYGTYNVVLSEYFLGVKFFIPFPCLNKSMKGDDRNEVQ
jgi:hypothetical protein